MSRKYLKFSDTDLGKKLDKFKPVNSMKKDETEKTNNIEVTYEEVKAEAKEIKENAKKHDPNALYQVRRNLVEEMEGWKDAGILNVQKPLNWWIDQTYANISQLEVVPEPEILLNVDFDKVLSKNEDDLKPTLQYVFMFTFKIYCLLNVFLFSFSQMYEFVKGMHFLESLTVHLLYYMSFVYIALKTIKK